MLFDPQVYSSQWENVDVKGSLVVLGLISVNDLSSA